MMYAKVPVSTIKEYEQRIAELELELAFYADLANYMPRYADGQSEVQRDCGMRARNMTSSYLVPASSEILPLPLHRNV